ncbi:MAG: hypothetical protein ACKKL6_00585 [Candidatus Komeilibacteria bacterium]
MEYELRIKKPKKGPNKNDIVLSITDIKLHTAYKRQSSTSKTIKKYIDNKEPGRIYRNIEELGKNESFLELIKNDPDLKSMIAEYEKQGKRVFIQVPKEIPIYPSEDTKQFISSKKGKRIVRGIAKGSKI